MLRHCVVDTTSTTCARTRQQQPATRTHGGTCAQSSSYLVAVSGGDWLLFFFKRIDRGRFGSLSSLQDDRHPPAHPYLFFPFFIKSLVKMWKYIFLMYIYRRDKSNVPGSFNIVPTYIEVIPRGIPKRGVEYMGVLYFLKNSCLKS